MTARQLVALFAIFSIVLIVLLMSDPQPPRRKRVRVARKPQTGVDNIIRDDFNEQRKRG